VGIVFKNNAKTTLASSLSNSATSATVTDGSVFPSLSAGEFFLITFDDGSNNEICKCTARSGNTLTIVRAQESTTARAFSSGDAAEGRVTAGVLETIQENIAAKSANQTVFNTTTAGGATTYNIGTNPGVEANAMVFLNGVLQHHDTISFSGTNLTFDAAPPNGMALEVIIDNLINLQSSNLTVDTFTAADVSGNPQTDFTLSDTPAAETNLIVFVDGVFQDQDAYTISSNTLTITTGVIAGRGVTVYVINPVNIGTPSDSTVTSAKLSGNITMPGTLTVGSNDVAFDSPTFVVDHTNSRVGLGTASPSVPVDIVGEVKTSSHINIGGNLVKASGDLTLDVAGDIILDSAGSDFLFQVGGTNLLKISNSSLSTDFTQQQQDTDIRFKGNDGGSTITALTLDMSEAGKALFNKGATFNELVTIDGGSTVNTVLALDSSTANTFLKITDSNTNEGNFIGCTTDDLTFFTRNTERVRFDGTGAIQIGGTTNAGFIDFDSTKLQLNTQRNPNTGAFVNTSRSHASIELNGADGGSSILLRTAASNNTASSERMRIDSSGMLGLGTTPPTDSHSTWSQFFIGQKGSVISERLGSGGLYGTYITDNLYVDSDTGNFAYRVANEASAYLQEASTHRWYTVASGSAGAAATLTERMRITSDGGIGFGTSGPISFGGGAFEFSDTSSNQTGVRITAATKSAEIGVDNDGGYLQTVTDGGGWKFYTSDGGVANKVPLFIKNTGIILGGTTSAPNYPGTFTAARTGSSSTTNQATWSFNATAGGSSKDFGYKATGSGSYAYGVLNAAETTWMSRLDFSGAIHLTNTTVQSISDRRLKKDIVDANSQWDDIKALQFKNFKWIDDSRGDGTYLGLIADEVESVSPGLVGIDAISAETMPEDGVDPEYKNVKYSILWMKATKALQESMARIETLEAKVEALENK